MNSLVTQALPITEMVQSLRFQLLDSLADEHLAFTPGGENPTLGQLCVELGQVEKSYLDSFKTFTHDFSYRVEDPTVGESVGRLREWYTQLDQEFKDAISALTEEQVNGQIIDRGHGFSLPLRNHLFIYHEAVLIFAGKVSVYLKMLGIPRSEQWEQWIS